MRRRGLAPPDVQKLKTILFGPYRRIRWVGRRRSRGSRSRATPQKKRGGRYHVKRTVEVAQVVLTKTTRFGKLLYASSAWRSWEDPKPHKN